MLIIFVVFFMDQHVIETYIGITLLKANNL